MVGTDLAGNTSQVALIFNTEPPLLTVEFPVDQSLLNTSEVQVVGLVEAMGVTVNEIEVVLTGGVCYPISEGYFITDRGSDGRCSGRIAQ